VDPEDVEEGDDNVRIDGRKAGGELIGEEGAAETVAGEDGLGDVARFPGVNMVGVHQIFNRVKGDDGHAEGQRNQNHPNLNGDCAEIPANRCKQTELPLYGAAGWTFLFRRMIHRRNMEAMDEETQMGEEAQSGNKKPCCVCDFIKPSTAG
jgi:hypothetical protein